MKIILKNCVLALGIFTLILSYNQTFAKISDTSYSITPFSWSTISNIEDIILQNENSKKLTKNSLQQTKKGNTHYNLGVASMNSQDYNTATIEFKNAMKRYKRAKLNDNSLNYVIANIALAYANNTENEKNQVLSGRFLTLLTKKIYKEPKWTYNIAITHYLVGNNDEAARLLNSCIKMNNFDFQSYVTLESIYRESGNIKEANKVTERMSDAEIKLAKSKLKSPKKRKKKSKKTNIASIPKGERPDIANLKIVKKIDHTQYNKTKNLGEKQMKDINEGVSFYDSGVDALSNKNYASAQENLKNAEKKLKRGKIVDDGLNFTRANLAISCLNSTERRGVSQAKRYLRYITPKLYKTREWTYNMAVANYSYSQKTKGAQKDMYTKEAIRLFQLTIRQDKLFLPAYENLIYVYNELNDTKKADKTHKSYIKSRNELMKSFSKQEQKSFGLENPYIFRINLGTFSEFNTPVEIFEETYLISVPLNDTETSYLSGMFYTLDEAIEYQKRMKKKGFNSSFIVAFKDGDKLEF